VGWKGRDTAVCKQNSMTDFALNRGRTVGMVRGAISAAITATMELCQGPHTHTLAQVDVTGNGSYTKLSGAAGIGDHAMFIPART